MNRNEEHPDSQKRDFESDAKSELDLGDRLRDVTVSDSLRARLKSIPENSSVQEFPPVSTEAGSLNGLANSGSESRPADEKDKVKIADELSTGQKGRWANSKDQKTQARLLLAAVVACVLLGGVGYFLVSDFSDQSRALETAFHDVDSLKAANSEAGIKGGGGSGTPDAEALAMLEKFEDLEKRNRELEWQIAAVDRYSTNNRLDQLKRKREAPKTSVRLRAEPMETDEILASVLFRTAELSDRLSRTDHVIPPNSRSRHRIREQYTLVTERFADTAWADLARKKLD